jgi:hypothetical protein
MARFDSAYLAKRLKKSKQLDKRFADAFKQVVVQPDTTDANMIGVESNANKPLINYDDELRSLLETVMKPDGAASVLAEGAFDPRETEILVEQWYPYFEPRLAPLKGKRGLSPAIIIRALKLGLTELQDVNLRVADRLAEKRENDSIWTTNSPLNLEEARVFTTVVFQAKAELNRDSIPGTPARYGTTRAAFHKALSDGMEHDDVPVNLIAAVNQAMLNMRNGLRSLPENRPLRAPDCLSVNNVILAAYSTQMRHF